MATDLEIAEHLLREAALKYARMKTFMVIVNDNNGAVTRVNQNDVEGYANVFRQEMEDRAINLLLEMSLPSRTSK